MTARFPAATRGLGARRPGAAALLVLLAPLVGLVVLRAPLVNQLPFRDPWLYSAYGWDLRHGFDIFGWYYYGVRFPAVLPIDWGSRLLGPVGGYLTVRAIILVLTGALVYATVRRATTRVIAGAAVIALALSPSYMRSVLWDYTSYVCVPCSIAGAALWLLSAEDDARPWRFVVAGVLVGAGLLANALTVVLLPVLLVIELVRLRQRGGGALLTLVRRVGLAAAGALLCFGLGWLLYCAQLGWISPYELLRPTIEFARVSDQYVIPLQASPSEWLLGEPRIWAPPLIALATIAAMRRRLLADDLGARLAQLAVLFVVVMWAYRFLITSSLIETWWAYDMAALVSCFGIPMILAGLASDDGRRLVVAALASTMLVTLVLRSASGPALDVYDALAEHAGVLIAVLLVALAAIAALWARRAVVPATAALFASIALLGLAPAGHLGNGEVGNFSKDGAEELAGYAAGHAMVRLLAEEDTPAGRVLLWSELRGITAAGWANLPHLQGGIQNVEAPQPLPALTPEMLPLVRYPTTRALLVMTERPQVIEQAVQSLRAHSITATVGRKGTWGGGRVHYALLNLRAGGGDDTAAVRSVAGAYLAALAGGPKETGCQVLVYELRVEVALAAGASTCEAGLRPTTATIRSVDVDSIRGTAKVFLDGRETPLELERIGSLWSIVSGAQLWAG